LNRLYKNFNSSERTQALNGLGGIGKTQTAVEYAYRHRQDYEVVLWAGANTRETLVADYAAIADLLDLPEKNAQDQGEAVGAVKRWLENNDGWLLILDNADDLAMAREFIPSSERGHVLLTTRAQSTGTIAVRNKVEKLEPREGAFLLLRRMKKLNDGESMESAPAELRTQAEALSKELDGLPLALDQAAAFIDETPSSLGEYLSLYRRERSELLSRRGELTSDHLSVTATFSLAFEKVEKVSSAAADLLRVCSFLEADSIPEEIFSEGAEELGEALASSAESPLKLTLAIGEAGRFSLLGRNPETQTVSLHRLVQDVLRAKMDKGTERIWAERAVRAVNSAFPDVKYAQWASCSRLIPHAQLLASLVEGYGFNFPEAARLLNQAGHYLNERAQYEEAEPLYRQALAIYEKALGAEHPDVATVLNNLAELYHNQGKYKEAETLYKRALAIYEKVLVAEHPYTAMSLNNLAALYQAQGRYEEAETLYKRALAIREKVLVAEHPDTAMSLNNLALLYQAQGRYEEAEPLYKRALAIREKVLRAEHPNTALSLNNLAELYRAQGRYEEAEPLYKRALAICEKVLGGEHPYTASSLNNLALLYRAQGRYEEAETLYKRALAICEKVLVAEHPDTITVSENYAALLREMKGEEEAADPPSL
jgi:tetratricopeptide (TPR) repeat protein